MGFKNNCGGTGLPIMGLVDINIAYTGCDHECNGVTIKNGMSLRQVLDALLANCGEDPTDNSTNFWFGVEPPTVATVPGQPNDFYLQSDGSIWQMNDLANAWTNSGIVIAGGIAPEDIGLSLHIDADEKLNAGSDPSNYDGTVSIGGTAYPFTYSPGSVIFAADPSVTDLNDTTHLAVSKVAVQVGSNVVEAEILSLKNKGGLGMNVVNEGAGVLTIQSGSSGIHMVASTVGIGVPAGGTLNDSALRIQGGVIYATANISAGANTISVLSISAGTVVATALRVTPGNAPASATAPGTPGDIRVVSGFIYVCVAANTWQRAPLATW